jgi:hypothetical protein
MKEEVRESLCALHAPSRELFRTVSKLRTAAGQRVAGGGGQAVKIQTLFNRKRTRKNRDADYRIVYAGGQLAHAQLSANIGHCPVLPQVQRL